MSVLNCTVVGHARGEAPEILMKNRPFSDCDSVGAIWLHNTLVKMLGKDTDEVFTRKRNLETCTNANGAPYTVATTNALFLGIVPFASYYVVEN